eukprot:1160399-Pelagomonas_calceolata.AAC.2
MDPSRDREASKAEAEKAGKVEFTKEIIMLLATALAFAAFFMKVGAPWKVKLQAASRPLLDRNVSPEVVPLCHLSSQKNAPRCQARTIAFQLCVGVDGECKSINSLPHIVQKKEHWTEVAWKISKPGMDYS